MLIAGLVFAAIAALIHVYIFVLESVMWTAPRTRATFGIESEADARLTRPLAFNQGFYNLFLAIAVFLGIGFVWAGVVAVGATLVFVGATLVFVGTGSMVAAGLVLLLSSPARARPALVQLVPPLIAIVLVAVGLLNA